MKIKKDALKTDVIKEIEKRVIGRSISHPQGWVTSDSLREIADIIDIGNDCKYAILENKKIEKSDIVKINLNDRVKVKLTPHGADIYYHQFDEINKQYGKEVIKPYMPWIDREGYTEFQLWALMEMYGEHIHICEKIPFEPNIIIED